MQFLVNVLHNSVEIKGNCNNLIKITYLFYFYGTDHFKLGATWKWLSDISQRCPNWRLCAETFTPLNKNMSIFSYIFLSDCTTAILECEIWCQLSILDVLTWTTVLTTRFSELDFESWLIFERNICSVVAERNVNEFSHLSYQESSIHRE